MNTRAKFIARFGVDDISKIESAALQHNNLAHNNPGSDLFRYALIICVGFECFTKYKDAHNFTVDAEELRKWVLEERIFNNHDGDVDYLSLAVGVYRDWVDLEVPSDTSS